MLRNRKEFLKYLNTALKSEPNYGGPLTKETWPKIFDRIKANLPTCPIVCLEGKALEVLQVRLDYMDCPDEDKEFLEQMRNEIADDRQTELKDLADKRNKTIQGILKAAKEAQKEYSKLDISDEEVQSVTERLANRVCAEASMVQQHINQKYDETAELLSNILDNPMEYESRGMPFEMVMVLTTDWPEHPLLGMLFVEIDPDSWLVIEISKVMHPSLRGLSVEVKVEGGLTLATRGAVKGLDYVLNQRQNIIEIEPTSMGLGQHLTFLSKKTRQLPQHLIYIGSKKKLLKDYPQTASRIMRKPVFAHMVRGHWRVLWGNQKQGKDRHGNIIYNGYTWVIPHKRGKGELTEPPVYVVQ